MTNEKATQNTNENRQGKGGRKSEEEATQRKKEREASLRTKKRREN